MGYCIQHRNKVENQELIPMKSSQTGDLAEGKDSDDDYILTFTPCQPQSKSSF